MLLICCANIESYDICSDTLFFFFGYNICSDTLDEYLFHARISYEK